MANQSYNLPDYIAKCLKNAFVYAVPINKPTESVIQVEIFKIQANSIFTLHLDSSNDISKTHSLVIYNISTGISNDGKFQLKFTD